MPAASTAPAPQRQQIHSGTGLDLIDLDQPMTQLELKPAIGAQTWNREVMLSSDEGIYAQRVCLVSALCTSCAPHVQRFTRVLTRCFI